MSYRHCNQGITVKQGYIDTEKCNFHYHSRFKSLNVDKEAELERYKVFAERLRPMVIETISFLHSEMKHGKHVLVEGANAAMLDIDFGKNCFFLIQSTLPE